jgi:hypothetical protein
LLACWRSRLRSVVAHHTGAASIENKPTSVTIESSDRSRSTVARLGRFRAARVSSWGLWRRDRAARDVSFDSVTTEWRDIFIVRWRPSVLVETAATYVRALPGSGRGHSSAF